MTAIRGPRRRPCRVALVAAVSIVVCCCDAYGATSVSATPNTWSVAPQRIAGELNGVSCLGLNRCVAVGEQTIDATVRPVAEFGNRDTWTVTPTPNPGHTTLTRSVVRLNGSLLDSRILLPGRWPVPSH